MKFSKRIAVIERTFLKVLESPDVFAVARGHARPIAKAELDRRSECSRFHSRPKRPKETKMETEGYRTRETEGGFGALLFPCVSERLHR